MASNPASFKESASNPASLKDLTSNPPCLRDLASNPASIKDTTSNPAPIIAWSSNSNFSKSTTPSPYSLKSRASWASDEQMACFKDPAPGIIIILIQAMMGLLIAFEPLIVLGGRGVIHDRAVKQSRELRCCNRLTARKSKRMTEKCAEKISEISLYYLR